MSRKPVIAGNWKMYKLIADSVRTAVELKPLVANANHCEVVIAPVYTAIKTVADRLEARRAHGRGRGGHAQRRGCVLWQHRPLRAAAVLPRDRLVREPEDPR